MRMTGTIRAPTPVEPPVEPHASDYWLTCNGALALFMPSETLPSPGIDFDAETRQS